MKLKNSFFITGTGTDIGKTYVSALFYKALKNMEVGYYKPIQSGGEKGKSPDVETVCSLAQIPYDEKMSTYVLKPSLSPHISAEIEKIELDFQLILQNIEKRKELHSYSIIEGAGGLCVPLNRDGYLYSNLIKESGLPVILVTSTEVGTINYTLLTLKYLEEMKIPVLGVVFNRFQKNFYEKDNIETILSLGKIKNHMIIDEGTEKIDIKILLNFLNNKKLEEHI
ncbi:MAG: dethiobiotin synthase [Fusobacteriaceae bacterium]